MRLTLLIALAVLALAFILVSPATADNPPGTIYKWSQTPYADGTTYLDKPVYLGWDEISWQDRSGVPPYQHLADDWHCTDNRPVTDIHWWGSYRGWVDQVPYPIKPVGFWFGIYTDVAAGVDATYSHPGQLLWQYTADSFVEQFVGYDRDPGTGQIADSTFQYNVYLPQTNWFSQTGPDNIYWLSIQAIYPINTPPPSPSYGWGWKTRPHIWGDDAVFSTDQLTVGWKDIYAYNQSWDMAFELSTPEPGSLAALCFGLMGIAGIAIRRRR